MFNWFRRKKNEDGKPKVNNNASDSGAIFPGIVASGLDVEDKKSSHDHSGNSKAAGYDYSSSNFDSGGSDGGGGGD